MKFFGIILQTTLRHRGSTAKQAPRMTMLTGLGLRGQDVYPGEMVIARSNGELLR